MKTTFYMQQVLQTTKVPIRFIAQITWVNMSTLKAIKVWSKNKIDSESYYNFIKGYKEYLEQHNNARKEMLCK